MLLRLKHTMGFMSLMAVDTPTGMCEADKEMFYTKLDSILNQCPRRDTLIVLGDFNADLKRRIHVFNDKCLRRIMGYR